METTGSSAPNKGLVYDEIRRIWVPATEEEKVRQRLVKRMIGELGYPPELLSVERSLADLCSAQSSVKIPSRRVDLMCFTKIPSTTGLHPLLAVECKESKNFEEQALSQVLGYNAFLGAPFIAVAYPEGETFGYRTLKGFKYLPYLPPYSELTGAIHHG